MEPHRPPLPVSDSIVRALHEAPPVSTRDRVICRRDQLLDALRNYCAFGDEHLAQHADHLAELDRRIVDAEAVESGLSAHLAELTRAVKADDSAAAAVAARLVMLDHQRLGEIHAQAAALSDRIYALCTSRELWDEQLWQRSFDHAP